MEQSINRRTFLKSSAIASIGFHPAVEGLSAFLGVQNNETKPLIKYAYRLSQPENQLRLEFYFVGNCHSLETPKNKGRKTVARKITVLPGQKEAYMVVRLTQQHIAEEIVDAYPDKGHLFVSRIAGYSYLAFRFIFQPGQTKVELPLTAKCLLDWNAPFFRLVVRQNLHESIFNINKINSKEKENTYPFGYDKSKIYDRGLFPKVYASADDPSPITAIEAPYHLVISPKLPGQDDYEFHWEFTQPIKGNLNELWVATLKLKKRPARVSDNRVTVYRTKVKEWPNQTAANRAEAKAPPIPEMEVMMIGSASDVKLGEEKPRPEFLLKKQHQSDLVRLYIIYKLTARAARMAFSPFGITTKLSFVNFKIELTSAARHSIHLYAWKQIISYGRDEEIEVVELAVCAETGLKILYVETAKRMTTKGGRAVLVKSVYLEPLELEKDFSAMPVAVNADECLPDPSYNDTNYKYKCPFKKLEVIDKDLKKRILDPNENTLPETDKVNVNEGAVAFWAISPQNGNYITYDCKITDWQDNAVFVKKRFFIILQSVAIAPKSQTTPFTSAITPVRSAEAHKRELMLKLPQQIGPVLTNKVLEALACNYHKEYTQKIKPDKDKWAEIESVFGKHNLVKIEYYKQALPLLLERLEQLLADEEKNIAQATRDKYFDFMDKVNEGKRKLLEVPVYRGKNKLELLCSDTEEFVEAVGRSVKDSPTFLLDVINGLGQEATRKINGYKKKIADEIYADEIQRIQEGQPFSASTKKTVSGILGTVEEIKTAAELLVVSRFDLTKSKFKLLGDLPEKEYKDTFETAQNGIIEKMSGLKNLINEVAANKNHQLNNVVSLHLIGSFSTFSQYFYCLVDFTSKKLTYFEDGLLKTIDEIMCADGCLAKVKNILEAVVNMNANAVKDKLDELAGGLEILRKDIDGKLRDFFNKNMIGELNELTASGENDKIKAAIGFFDQRICDYGKRITTLVETIGKVKETAAYILNTAGTAQEIGQQLEDIYDEWKKEISLLAHNKHVEEGLETIKNVIKEFKCAETEIKNRIEIGKRKFAFAVHEVEEEARKAADWLDDEKDAIRKELSVFETDYIVLSANFRQTAEGLFDFFDEYTCFPQLEAAQVYQKKINGLVNREIPVTIRYAEDYAKAQIDNQYFNLKKNASAVFAEIANDSKETVKGTLRELGSDLGGIVNPELAVDYFTYLRRNKEQVQKQVEETLSTIENEAGELKKNLREQIKEAKVAVDQELVLISKETKEKFDQLKSWGQDQAIQAKEYFKGLDAKILGHIHLKDILGEGFELPRLITKEMTLVYQFVTDKFVPVTLGPFQFINEAAQKKTTLALYFEKKLKESGYSSHTLLSNFAVGIMDKRLVVNFEKLEITANERQRDVKVRLGEIEFNQELAFLKNMSGAVSSLIGVPGLEVNIASNNIGVGYGFALPSISGGAFTLANLTFRVGVDFPLPVGGGASKPMTTTLAVNRPDSKFVVAAGIFGGRGYFQLKTTPKQLQMIDTAIEFGGYVGVNLGIAQGELFLMAGISFTYNYAEKLIEFRGYLICGGSVSVFGGLITVSVTFYIGLVYQQYQGRSTLYGTATLTYSVKVAFFKKTFSLSYSKRIFGADDGNQSQQAAQTASLTHGQDPGVLYASADENWLAAEDLLADHSFSEGMVHQQPKAKKKRKAGTGQDANARRHKTANDLNRIFASNAEWLKYTCSFDFD